jgi:pSer/pThr/pTyr-binding forkhead associated (FHA) protein
MAPIVLTLLQGLFLLLLYLFVWRIVRAILRDLRSTTPPARPAGAPAPRRPAAPVPAAAPRKPAATGGEGDRAQPRQLVVHGPGGAPQVLTLDREISFGRADPATVVLDDPYVSDWHARVWRDGPGWVVTDLGSTNGTFLNQRKVNGPTPIAAGDQLGIGRTTVEVRR